MNVPTKDFDKHWIIYSQAPGQPWMMHTIYVQRHAAKTAAGAVRVYLRQFGRCAGIRVRASLEAPNTFRRALRAE